MSTSADFWVTYSALATKFLSDNRADLLAYSLVTGVDVDAVAGSILREITGVDKVYLLGDGPQNTLRASVAVDVASGTLDGIPLGNFDLSTKILADYNKTLHKDYSITEKIINYSSNLVFTQFDIGPGKIRIDLAVDLIKEYLLTNSSNDVLGLKKYDGHYDQMFYDMYDDPSLTVKLAALVIKRGQAYFVGPDATYDLLRYPGGAQAQWDAYTPEQRTALLVKYYATGPENLKKEVLDKGFLSYDLDTHGSNITLFQNNLNGLRQVLGESQLSFEVNFPSPDNMKIDGEKTNADGSGLHLNLFSYAVSDSIGTAVAVSGPEVGEIRIDSLKSLTLSKHNDSVFANNTDLSVLNTKPIVIDAAAGDDHIEILGGSNITVIGGAGRDHIYNMSAGGIIYGDTFDGTYLDETGTLKSIKDAVNADAEAKTGAWHNFSDTFQWAPGVTIMDPGRNDHLTFFGFPLVGGDTSGGLPGLVAGGAAASYTTVGLGATQGFGTTYGAPVDSFYFDELLPFIQYKYTPKPGAAFDFIGGTLAVINVNEQLSALFGSGSSIPNPNAGVMYIKNFNFLYSYDGKILRDLDKSYGSLGMAFKKANPIWEVIAHLPDTAISVAATGGGNAFGPLIDAIYTAEAFLGKRAKSLRWATGGDPLVLDLTGRGLNTTSIDGSEVHFDLNNDFFSERTGWIGAGAGLLALDKNGNSKIDDVTELFGSYTGSGLGDLAQYDLNHDGKIDSADAVFAKLRVWQDANGDGVTDAGELQSLSQLGIASISLNGQAVNGTTPQGTEIRTYSTFTRTDGTTSGVYDAVFGNDQTNTVYRGESGQAAWAGPHAIDVKGFGRITNLAVATANDLGLAELVAARAAAMTVADLHTLASQAGDVLGAWGASLNLSRELTPVKTSADGKTLIDRAIYVEDATGGFANDNCISRQRLAA